jgi:DNA polymerase-3 subunit epsilon
VKILVVDTETTGLDPAKGAECVEVAAALYSVPYRAVLQTVGFLLPIEDNPAFHINRIEPRITQLDQPWRTALALFSEMAANADAVMAHNADFDRKWFGQGKLPHLHLPWLCSMELDWGKIPGRSLTAVALANGVTVTPDAHRAASDVATLTTILSKRDDLEELIAKAQAPRDHYQALLPYARKDEAKDLGFRWNPEKRAWIKALTHDELTALPFEVTRVA